MRANRISNDTARSSFTLIELVTAMAITSVLMLAMGSVMVIASNAIPDGNSPMEIATESRLVLDRMTEDLLFANSFTERTATAVAFSVPDRGHGAAGPETIRYAWSGTPGDPLTIEYNGAVATTVMDDVQAFALSYLVDTSQSGAVPLVEGSEKILFAQDASNLTGTYFYALPADHIESTYFIPSLPADAVSWSITRASFVGQASGKTKSSTMSVEIRSAIEGGSPSLHPDSTIIDQMVIQEATLTGSWQQVTFSTATGLDPAQGYHIAFVATGSEMNLEVATSPSPIPGTRSFEWTPAGGWAALSRSTWLWVWGKAMVPDPSGPAPGTSLLTGIRIEILAGPTVSSGVRTEVRILNEPDAGA